MIRRKTQRHAIQKSAAAFGGFDCWKIRATKGAEKSVLWFEKSTGLARGFEMTIDTQLGKLPVVTVFVEYKEFEGLKLPVRTEATQAGQKIVTVYDSVKFDTVGADQFELPAEIKACNPFLRVRIDALPELKAIVALGRIAHDGVLTALGAKKSAHPFTHGGEHQLGDYRLFDSYHCSRYNTNTRVLTPEMFRAVFARVRDYLDSV